MGENVRKLENVSRVRKTVRPRCANSTAQITVPRSNSPKSQIWVRRSGVGWALARAGAGAAGDNGNGARGEGAGTLGVHRHERRECTQRGGVRETWGVGRHRQPSPLRTA
eukprot:490794-Prymnesium_polylepis.1